MGKLTIKKRELNIIEAEYHELSSIFKIFKNFKYGIRILTDPEHYEEDVKNMVIEVKTRLQEIISSSKRDHDKGK